MHESPNRAHLQPSPWTDARFDTAKCMWAKGKSASEIEAELSCGLSRNAIMGKLFRAGLLGKMSDRVPRAKKPTRKSNPDRSATMRIKTLKVRGPSNGGAVVVESVVREELPQRADFLGITFAELDDKSCRYPRGEGAGIHFCGQPKMDGQSYCRHCSRIVYQPSVRPVLRPYYATGRSKSAVF